METIKVLPPRPGACRLCAARHAKDQPHERDSLLYQVRFYQKYRRFPTWEDAMAHCAPDVKAALRRQLTPDEARESRHEAGDLRGVEDAAPYRDE